MEKLNSLEDTIRLPSEKYAYRVVPSPKGTGLYISPEFTFGFMLVWFLRHANRVEKLDDVIDLAEYINYIRSYVMMHLYLEEGDNRYLLEEKKYEAERRSLPGRVSSLTFDQEVVSITNDAEYEDFL